MSSTPKKIIPFAMPSIGTEEEEAVLKVLRSGWLTTGRETLSFENEFRDYIDTENALAVASGTAGLHLALEAAGIQPNQFVVTTPYTFAATAEIIRYMHAHPLFVDIDKNSYNIDPEKIIEAIQKSSRDIAAIIPVHIAGRLCSMEAICSIAHDKKLIVVEDCAHAFPAATDSRYAGTFGDFGAFSFYANKTITTGEGGMVVTNNSEYADRMRIMRTHGIDREAWDRYSAQNKWYYEIIEPGFKYNLSDIASSIGRVQLKRAKEFLAKRKARAKQYINAFSDCDFLTVPEYSEEHAWHLFLIRINSEFCTLSRNSFIEKLAENGIGTSVHYTPLHIMPYYKNKYGYKPEDFPVSLSNSHNSISLPMYPDLSEEDCAYVIEIVNKIGEAHRPAFHSIPSAN